MNNLQTLKCRWKHFVRNRKLIKLLTICILLITQFNLPVNAYQDSSFQTISLKVREQKLSKVLEMIEEETDYSFFYNSKELKLNQTITIDFEGSGINEVLDKVFKETKIGYAIRGNQILLTAKTEKDQQSKLVKGKVTDEKGNPLPGVSIVMKGTSQGVVTDTEGKYFLTNIAEDDTLVFSFVGMKTQEVPVSGRTVINITLEESSIGIEEVVTIGYGSAKRKDLTSSISTLSAEELNKGSYVNPILSLQGKVPGLNITKDGNPNGNMAIMLRGPSTLRTGSAQSPLYVIDGVVDGVMPADDDIVSIDILRDASATSIYGSRAANGVIIITTKKGEPGKAVISYNSYIAFEEVSNKIDMLSANEYRSYLEANGLSLATDDNDGSSTNWFDEVSRTGISHNNNLTLGGGNNKTTYVVNIDYRRNQGIIKNSSINTLKVRANLEQKALRDKLKLGCTVTNVVSDAGTVNDGLYLTMWNYLPTVGIYNKDGNYHENLVRASYNPVALIEQNTYESNGKAFSTTLRAQLNILKGLDYEISGTYKTGQSNYESYLSKESAIAQGYNGYAYRNSYRNENKLVETFATYSKTFKKHDFKILAGYSWQESQSGNGFGVNSTNFVSDETSFYNLSLGSNYNGFKPSYDNPSYSILRMISFYSRMNYSFMDKYLLQATIRQDGSSAFGKNNRWGYFPSASAGWRIMEEPFVKNLNFFDNLKLRAGYGISGNSLGFDPLISQLRYGVSGTAYYSGEYINGIAPTQNENNDLKWERTAMLNVGLDFSVFNGRLSGTLEYYDKITKDLIWTYSVSTTNYFVDTYTANVGEMENKGYEISISAIPVKTNGFSWNTTLTLSHNKNKLNTLSDDQFQSDYVYIGSVGNHGQSGMNSQIIESGHPIGQFYLWKYAGKDADGVSQFYDADGELTINPSTSDRYYAGSAQPKCIFGWHNTLTYRNFSLDFLFRGVTGNKVLNVTMSNLNYPAEATHYNMSRMTLSESVNDVNAHYTSTRYLEKGDYLRLDNITLAYTFDLTGSLIKGLSLYATVNNAFVITDYKGTDPEVFMGGLTPGIDDDNYYPKTRSFIFGVNVDF